MIMPALIIALQGQVCSAQCSPCSSIGALESWQGDQAKDFLDRMNKIDKNKIVGWGELEELYQVVNRLQMTSLDF